MRQTNIVHHRYIQNFRPQHVEFNFALAIFLLRSVVGVVRRQRAEEDSAECRVHVSAAFASSPTGFVIAFADCTYLAVCHSCG